MRNADVEIHERLLRVDNAWFRARYQLNFLKRIEGQLEEDHRSIQCRLLTVLATKLQLADSKLQGVLKKSNVQSEANTFPGLQWQVKKWKYALFAKNTIDHVLSDLRDWQDTFDPSWYLIMRVSGPQFELELTQQSKRERHSSPIAAALSIRAALKEDKNSNLAMILPPDRMSSIEWSPLLYCSAKLGKISSAFSTKCLIAESMTAYRGEVMFEEAEILARKLSHSDPLTFGLLSCKGIIKKQPQPDISLALEIIMVYRMPEIFTRPRSLRHLMLEARSDFPLNAWFDLATQLARAIGYVHTFGFVHKNIRPETILVFENASPNSNTVRSPGTSIGTLTLIGFDDFRAARRDAETLLRRDKKWEKDLYRHPRRQNSVSMDKYTMQHDIYSLGVCLLELGLWISFVEYGEGNTCMPAPSYWNLAVLDADKLKEELVILAREKLPQRMGNKYAKVAETCLTCLDSDNEAFGDESESLDSNGVLIGVKYIEKVRQLNQNVVVESAMAQTHCTNLGANISK